MFQPRYQISPRLLDTIKRIAILIHELNKWALTEPQLAELRAEASVTSTCASTSIEGNHYRLRRYDVYSNRSRRISDKVSAK